jgi:hypothetical protein
MRVAERENAGSWDGDALFAPVTVARAVMAFLAELHNRLPYVPFTDTPLRCIVDGR